MFLEGSAELDKKENLKALIPTLIYAVIAIALNLARVIYGPYVFLKVYEQGVLMTFVWIVLISALVYGIAFLLKLGNTKINAKK